LLVNYFQVVIGNGRPLASEQWNFTETNLYILACYISIVLYCDKSIILARHDIWSVPLKWS